MYTATALKTDKPLYSRPIQNSPNSLIHAPHHNGRFPRPIQPINPTPPRAIDKRSIQPRRPGPDDIERIRTDDPHVGLPTGPHHASSLH